MSAPNVRCGSCGYDPARARPEPFVRGTVLEQRYRIDDEVGRGGMGVVYRGTDLTLQRPVAIKALWGQAAGSETVNQFLTEARALAQIEHPRVVPVYAVGRHGGAYFMVMKFIDGQPLSDHLKLNPIVEPERVRQIMLQSLDALGALHARGLVHRDVKPGNLMIQSDGQVTLMDLGIARDLNDASATTQALGTPRYMAPETLRNQPEDARTDLYSLAVIGWHTLVGRPPFDGPTPMAILYKQAHAQAQPLREAAPHVPRELADTIERAMSKDPAERFASAAVMSAALRGAPPRPRATGRKAQAIGLAVGALLVAAGGIAGWWFNRPEPPVGGEVVGTVLASAAPTLAPLPPPRFVDAGTPPTHPSSHAPTDGGVDAAPASVAALVPATTAASEPPHRPASRPPPPPPISIDITSTPNGATVIAEGQRIGRTPMTLRRASGRRSLDLVFERSGHEKARASVSLSANGKVHVKLEPLFDLVP